MPIGAKMYEAANKESADAAAAEGEKPEAKEEGAVEGEVVDEK